MNWKMTIFVGVINGVIFMLYWRYVSMFVLEDEQILCLFRVCRGNLCNYFEYILISSRYIRCKKTYAKIRMLCSMSFFWLWFEGGSHSDMKLRGNLCYYYYETLTSAPLWQSTGLGRARTGTAAAQLTNNFIYIKGFKKINVHPATLCSLTFTSISV